MAFAGSTLWTVDNYTHRFTKHTPDPRVIAETYRENSRSGVDKLVFDGKSFWSITPEFIYKFGNPPDTNLAVYKVSFNPHDGTWAKLQKMRRQFELDKAAVAQAITRSSGSKGH